MQSAVRRRVVSDAVKRFFRHHSSNTPMEAVIGLEVHAQLNTASKLFSGGGTEFGVMANSETCLLDAAIPGAMPVLNESVVRKAVDLGLAVGGEVQPKSVFERKHYFYPDLPLGFQITQRLEPIVRGGEVQLGLGDDSASSVRLVQIQLEQDSGKSVHTIVPGYSHVDMNRAGAALLEIVTEPDIRSSSDAGSFVKKLQLLLRTLNVSDGNMEQGSLRCDANISIRPVGSDSFGERVEVKNLNSIRSLVEAIDHEIARQKACHEKGERIQRETRSFDAKAGKTIVQRSKENMMDYRFMPEPDLPPLKLSQGFVDSCALELPELPDKTVERLVNIHGLNHVYVCTLVNVEGGVKFFEEVVSKDVDEKASLNWILNEVLGRLRSHEQLLNCPIQPDRLADLVRNVERGVISGKMGKEMLDNIFKGDQRHVEDIIREDGLAVVSDEKSLEVLCREILDSNPSQVEKYLSGKDRIFGFFVGEAMKKTKGQASPKIVNKVLKEILKSM